MHFVYIHTFSFLLHSEFYSVGSSNGLKISKVVTKSKFGAPSSRKRPNQISLTATTSHATLGAATNNSPTTAAQREDLAAQPKRRLIATHQILPSISTLKKQQLQQQGGVTAIPAPGGSHNMNQTALLPNDQFTRLYGRPFADDRSTNSVVTLTPPSSPDIEPNTEDNVGSLVDEHFRHSMQRFATTGKKTNPASTTVVINAGNVNSLVGNATVIEQDFAGVVNRLLNGDEGKVC